MYFALYFKFKGKDPEVPMVLVKEPTDGMFVNNSENGQKVIDENCFGMKIKTGKWFDTKCDERSFNGKMMLPLCQYSEPSKQGIDLSFLLF